MEAQETAQALKALTDYGVLGSLVVILLLTWRSTISKLMTLVENNTKTVAANTETMKEVRKTMEKCERRP